MGAGHFYVTEYLLEFGRSSKQHGEMAEWLKAHAWKACIPQGIQGSNPCLSAIPCHPYAPIQSCRQIAGCAFGDNRFSQFSGRKHQPLSLCRVTGTTRCW